MDLRVIVIAPLHMRSDDIQIAPLMQAIPQYRLLTGNVANNWKNFVSKNSFTVGDISNDFSSIQDCLNAVPAGSFIKVYPGLYNETITIVKPVTLMAATGLSNTFLTAAVIISTSHVTLNGFTLKSDLENKTQLTIEGSHVHVQNCKFIGRYMVDQQIDLHKLELAISCRNCRHVKILNNIFYQYMFGLSLDNVEHFTIRSNTFSYGYTSMVMQRSANVRVVGNQFKFNRAVMWLDNSSEASGPSFADNIYHSNLQSDVCSQYRNQIMYGQNLIYVVPKFGELKDLQCHHMNVFSTVNTTTRKIMVLPDHVIFKGWCGRQVDGQQTTGTPWIDEQLYAQTGCILLLGNVVSSVYPQGTNTQLIMLHITMC